MSTQLVEIILGVISGGAVTSLFMLKSKKRSSDTQSYKLLIDDLNQRMDAALTKMRELETELERVKTENSALRIENDQLRAENAKLKKQLS